MAGVAALRTLYMPQVEQFGLGKAHVSAGGNCELYQDANERADGWLWVYGLDDSCLVAVHDVGVQQPFVLEEQPDESLCLASMSRSTVSCWFEPKAERAAWSLPSLSENVVAFSQERRPVSGLLESGRRYTSASITLKPGFFERRGAGRLYRTLDERLAAYRDGALYDLPVELRSIMRGLASGATKAASGSASANEAQVQRMIARALGLLAEHVEALMFAERSQGDAEQLRLVLQAQNLIDAQLNELLTIGELAERLNVGRTRLCSAFKAETGTSIGAWARARRVERARELLVEDSLSMAEVARAVGYERLGSFDDMFRAETGITPSEWKSLH